MYTSEQQDELLRFIEAQLSKLAAQLAEPMAPGDSLFVHDALPAWMGEGLQHRFAVLWSPPQGEQPGRFVLVMDIDFGRYHRRMELVAGDPAFLLKFATDHPPAKPLCDAIVELMAMEQSGK